MNKKYTKSALFGSVIALILCCAMLVGTTFAWFTDDATTGVNTIQSGTLEVDIIKADGSGDTLQGKTLTLQGLNGNQLFEPGATFTTEAFQIKSNGNLALKFKLEINGTNVSDHKLMEVLTFKVVDESKTAVDIAKFEGHLTPASIYSGAYTIQATMDTDAGNEYQGLTCSTVSITVYATQDTVESDMTDNKYDANAQYMDNVVLVNTPDELVNAFNNLERGAVISLGADLDMSGKTLKAVNGNVGFTLNGNGHTISNLSSTASGLFVDHSGSDSYTFKDLTLSNCSVDSADNYAALFVGDGDTSGNIAIDNCAVNNCTVNGAKYAAMFVAYGSGYGVDNNGPVYAIHKITDCTVTGGSVTGGGSTGIAVAHAGGNDATETYITNLTATNVIVTGEDAEHEGLVVGTANVGKCWINDITSNGVTMINNKNTGIQQLYGRFVPGTTGKLYIDNNEITN